MRLLSVILCNIQTSGQWLDCKLMNVFIVTLLFSMDVKDETRACASSFQLTLSQVVFTYLDKPLYHCRKNCRGRQLLLSLLVVKVNYT